MRSEINGKVYDTTAAEWVAFVPFYEARKLEELYRSKDGEHFLYECERESGGQYKKSLRPLSASELTTWLEIAREHFYSGESIWVNSVLGAACPHDLCEGTGFLDLFTEKRRFDVVGNEKQPALFVANDDG